MAFDNSAYEENERRKVVARQLKKIPHELQNAILNILNNNGRRTDYFQTCISCTNFEKENEVCKLAGTRPPAKVIADGCTSYTDNDDWIPF
jgi:hypothetical protein